MATNDLLAEIVSKYGQYNNPSAQVNPFQNLNSAGTFVSTLANGQGAGATMSPEQQAEARYYMLKSMQQAGVQGKVRDDEAQWLGLAGSNGYGYTQESVLDQAKRNILTYGKINPEDVAVLEYFNQGPTRWGTQAGTFQTEADRYQANSLVRNAGQAMGYQAVNPFDGQNYNDESVKFQMQQYAQANPGWRPMPSTYKGGPPPSVGLGAGSYANGENPYPEKPGALPNTNWTASNPTSTTTAAGQPAQTTAAQNSTYKPEGAGTNGVGIPPYDPNAGQTASPTYGTANTNPYKTGFAGNGLAGGVQGAAQGYTGDASLTYAQKQKKNLNFIS